MPPIDVSSPGPIGTTPLQSDTSPEVHHVHNGDLDRSTNSRINDTVTSAETDEYLPPLSATPPTSPNTARRRPAPDYNVNAKTPHTYDEDDAALKRRQLEELKR